MTQLHHYAPRPCRAHRIGTTWLWLVAAVLLTGCAGGLAPVDNRTDYGPAPPGYYRIRTGDTLSEIAEARRIGMGQLAAWNDLKAPYPLYAGALLRVEPPGRGRGSGPRKASRSAPSPSARPVKTAARPSSRATAAPGSAAAASGIKWQWPLTGAVKQGYRAGDRTQQGLRIAATPGAPVAAAAAGTVVYSGSGLKGYGNLIIVKHNSRFLSAYGFNRRLLATEGDRVKRGQVLAEAGQSADGQPLLHFEIRRDGRAVDPMAYLP